MVKKSLFDWYKYRNVAHVGPEKNSKNKQGKLKARGEKWSIDIKFTLSVFVRYWLISLLFFEETFKNESLWNEGW